MTEKANIIKKMSNENLYEDFQIQDKVTNRQEELIIKGCLDKFDKEKLSTILASVIMYEGLENLSEEIPFIDQLRELRDKTYTKAFKSELNRMPIDKLKKISEPESETQKFQVKYENIIDDNSAIVKYYGPTFNNKNLINYILEHNYLKNETIIVAGKTFTVERKTCSFSDSNLEYHYSGISNKSINWDEKILKIKKKVEKITNQKYNYCLVNYYKDGSIALGYHSDSEKDLEPNSIIASVTFGAERDMLFKNKKDGKLTKILLEHGSLLTMEGKTQKLYKHSIPKRTKVKEPRINLTFRLIKK